MPYALLYSLCPAIAQAETRSIIVQPGYDTPVPPDEYTFCEMFCDEPGCDCRRVMFTVVSERRRTSVACIAFGWESPEFYKTWLGDDDPLVLANLMGPVLNMGSPQSELADAILSMFTTELLLDTAYMNRVKRHYTLFRQALDQSAMSTNASSRSANTPRNAACPCGSGKKYKSCCGSSTSKR